MKITKKQLAITCVSALVLILALLFMILDFCKVVKFWDYAWHPILTFLLFVFLGFGVICFTLGISKKSPFYFMLSAVLIGLGLFGIIMHYIIWWICLIAVVVLWIIVALVSFISAGNKTESISLNASPDYKNYKERRAEEIETPEEELPEIKSFK